MQLGIRTKDFQATSGREFAGFHGNNQFIFLMISSILIQILFLHFLLALKILANCKVHIVYKVLDELFMYKCITMLLFSCTLICHKSIQFSLNKCQGSNIQLCRNSINSFEQIQNSRAYFSLKFHIVFFFFFFLIIF